jgi:hypothetical protein
MCYIGHLAAELYGMSTFSDRLSDGYVVVLILVIMVAMIISIVIIIIIIIDLVPKGCVF